MRSVLTRRKQDSQPEEKAKTEAGIGGCTLKMKEGAISQRMQAGLDAGRGQAKDSPLETPEGASPADIGFGPMTLISDFWSPEP